MSKSRSLEKFRLKQMVKQLSTKKGFHTELISLYIPPQKRMSDVIGYLKQEASTAVNIKSRLTRKNVTNAITTVIQRLKLINETPENGLVVFCGAIPETGPGTENMEIYLIIPPEKFNVFNYQCSNEFWLDPLKNMLLDKASWGLMVVARAEATFALLRGTHLDIQTSITSGIPGKIRAGGQSQRRYQRVIEQLAHEFYVRIGEHASQIFLELEDLKGILIGGSGITKQTFLDGDYLDYRLKEKVIGLVDLAYSGPDGIYELLDRGREKLENVRYLEEKQLFQEFLKQISEDTELVAYGEEEVRQSLIAGAVSILLLSETLDLVKINIKCKNCDYAADKLADAQEAQEISDQTEDQSCPKCGTQNLITTERSLLEELTELAETTNTQVEIISPETEEGQQLIKGFGGIAAILRFKIQT